MASPQIEPLKRGTQEVEKTVMIKAELSARLCKVANVIEDVKEAGASPVQLAIEVERDRNYHPDLYMLVVAVGDQALDLTKVIRGGIKMVLNEFTLKRSEKYSIPKEFVGIEIAKDSEYVIDGKPASKTGMTSY